MSRHILVVNAGSSSVKVAVFDVASPTPRLRLRTSIPQSGRSRRLEVAMDAERPPLRFAGAAGPDDLPRLVEWVEAGPGLPLAGVAHRIVHGGNSPAAVAVCDASMAAATALAPLAPLHQAAGLAGVSAVRLARPELPQVLVFDTAFHRGHSPVVDALGLPRAWVGQGLRRYGFHGLSYEHVAERLQTLDPQAAKGRVLIAHLGSGASLCALHDGRSVDTTMGATPLDGLVMGTRCGSLDPGVVLYMQQAHGLSVDEVADLLYRRSGLLGVSGLSADLRVLLASDDANARAAVDLFVFRIAREAGALVSTLGGLDGLVFTGGVGENSAEIRARVCERFGWLGVELGQDSGQPGEARISAAASRVAIWTIPTDEERVMARHARELLATGNLPRTSEQAR